MFLNMLRQNEAVEFFIALHKLVPVTNEPSKFIGELPGNYDKSTRMWFSGGLAVFVNKIKINDVDGVEFIAAE